MDLFWEIKRAILAQFLLHGRTDLAGEAWKEILQKSLLSEHPTNEGTNAIERGKKMISKQCDQIWQNFANLSKIKKSLALYLRLIWYLTKFRIQIGTICMLLGKI